MQILTFFVTLMSAAILLLFGVHLVRGGVERKFGPYIRDCIATDQRNWNLLGLGALSALIMQGGTAVVLMVAGLASSGALPLISAATVALGAELGSAMVLIFLNFPITDFSPAFILAGGIAYLWSKVPNRRTLGKIMLGLGLIFLALVQIKATAEPFRDLAHFAQVSGYLNEDIVSCALLGMVLTLLMHSSVAALLTLFAFAIGGGLDVRVGIAIALGANIGSALIPIWLLGASQRGSDAGWSIAKALGAIRIGAACLFVTALIAMPSGIIERAPFSSAQAIVLTHLTFNALMLLAVFSLPVVLKKPIKKTDIAASAKCPILVDPELQQLQFKQHVLSMLDDLSTMMDAVFANPPDEVECKQAEVALKGNLAKLRTVFGAAKPPLTTLDSDLTRHMEFAIRIARATSLLSPQVLNDRMHGPRFSKQGAQEIDDFVTHVRGTILLAHEVLATGAVPAARRLVERKQSGAATEQTSRQNHLRRLQLCDQASLASSEEHLELIASLKELNSKLCTIAYAILDAEGALKKTRLKSVPKIDRNAS